MNPAFSSGILTSLFVDDTVQEIFSDEQYIQTLLEVESALAQAEAVAGLIPELAAAQITAGIATFTPNMPDIKQGMAESGVPMIALVRQLRTHIGGEAATYLHWGATSQDIMDTALVLQIRAVLDHLTYALTTLIKALAELADTHRQTVMAGRTHSQQAVPISFGVKVAGWLAPLLRHVHRMTSLRQRVLVVQFGGAAGTLAPLGEQGSAVEAAFAKQLKLGIPLTPWHTQRDNLAELAGWLALVTGSLGKMAQDIILMSQTEIGELRELADLDRGGSSTMPQKHNPVMSERIVAAARLNATLLSSHYQALLQEHERATHSWQLEWLTLPQMLMLTGSAIKQALILITSLDIRQDRMRENIERSRGLISAEAISFVLSAHMSRTAAQQIVRESCVIAETTNRHLIEVVKEKVGDAVSIDWDQFADDRTYAGSSHTFIDRVLGEVNKL